MPLAFPSHQGLILPLWRRFPRRFDGVALCVGAAMPDAMDFALWPVRGELGQWLGHSLLGIFISIPAGLALAWAARRALPVKFISRLDDRADVNTNRPIRAAASIAIGAFSHVSFDLVTHGNFLLFWPWYLNNRAFPSWWYHTWTAIPLPVYREPYPVAPHTIAWTLFSILGVWLFFRCMRPLPAEQPGD
ncbi:MAG: DUF4184 family protein [Planctomycetes bacterium]|nr:DUF4184 family protein [Planctomycetota bacterium]